MLKVKNLSKKRKIQLSILVVYSIICLAMLIYAIIGLAWISNQYASDFAWLTHTIKDNKSNEIWQNINKNIQPNVWEMVKVNNGQAYMLAHYRYLLNPPIDPTTGKVIAEVLPNVSSTYSSYMWGNAFGWLMLVPLILWLIVGLLLKYRPRPEPAVKLERKLLKEQKKAEKLAAKKAKKLGGAIAQPIMEGTGA